MSATHRPLPPHALALLLALLLALGGCSLAPRTVLTTPPVPTSWPAGDAYLTRSEAQLPLVSYRDIFRDPRLQTLVEQALANNRDLRVAASNLAAARAQVRVVRADQFPQVGVAASASRERRVGGGTDSALALQGGISAFEIDLFGRLANASAAQRDRALATEASARAVRLGLVGDLASAWANYAADRELFEIARATAAIARRSVTLTRARLNGGVSPRTDVRQAEQVLTTAEGDLARETAALAQDQNLLRLLVGAEFDPALLPRNLGEVIAATAPLPAGTSSAVLLRRPDVVEAEYQLRAANADIGVARARLFPTISLTSLAGLASGALSSLFTGGAFHYSLGADASWSLFNAGGRLANVEVSRAQRDAALAGYERAIQNAFREVSDALADQGTVGERLRAAGANTAAAADVARLAEARYHFGVDSFLASLDAQRSLYAARRLEVAVRLALVQNRIALYRVLGGDQASRPRP
ncbi:MAG: efflux transporter outer membrane subunit [Novosphingobium sp.]